MQHEHRCSRARRKDVSFRDVKIKIPESKIWPGDVNDVMHRKRARRIWGIWEKSVSWVLASEDGRLSGLVETRPIVCGVGRDAHVVGQMKKSAKKYCVSLSLCRITFNSKVIKSFVPELRSRKCFLCFRIPMLSINELWTFHVYFTYPYHGFITNGWYAIKLNQTKRNTIISPLPYFFTLCFTLSLLL